MKECISAFLRQVQRSACNNLKIFQKNLKIAIDNQMIVCYTVVKTEEPV